MWILGVPFWVDFDGDFEGGGRDDDIQPVGGVGGLKPILANASGAPNLATRPDEKRREIY